MFLIYIFWCCEVSKVNASQYKKEKPTSFIEGLPTPASAGVIVSIVLLISLTAEMQISKRHITLLISISPLILNFIPGIILLLSILMVTKLRYLKFNNIRLTKKVSFRFFSLVLVAILLIFAYPESSIFVIFSMYVLSGLLDYMIHMYKVSKSKWK